jgi:hypothetical protein
MARSGSCRYLRYLQREAAGARVRARRGVSGNGMALARGQILRGAAQYHSAINPTISARARNIGDARANPISFSRVDRVLVSSSSAIVLPRPDIFAENTPDNVKAFPSSPPPLSVVGDRQIAGSAILEQDRVRWDHLTRESCSCFNM